MIPQITDSPTNRCLGLYLIGLPVTPSKMRTERDIPIERDKYKGRVKKLQSNYTLLNRLRRRLLILPCQRIKRCGTLFIHMCIPLTSHQSQPTWHCLVFCATIICQTHSTFGGGSHDKEKDYYYYY